MGITYPYPKLSKQYPEDSLLRYPTIISVIGATLISLGFQLGLFLYTENDPFNERPWDEEEEAPAMESDANTILF